MKNEIVNFAPLLSKTFRITRMGIADYDRNVTFEECQRLYEACETFEGSLDWIRGDLLNLTEAKYGQSYSQLLDQGSYSRLSKAKWVSSRFEFCRRRKNLPFSHHEAVTSLEPHEQDRLLDMAERQKMSVKTLREAVRGYKKLMAGEEVRGLAEFMRHDVWVGSNTRFATGVPDGDGDCVSSDVTRPMVGPDIRVLIHPDCPRDSVVRVLRKLAELVEGGE